MMVVIMMVVIVMVVIMTVVIVMVVIIMTVVTMMMMMIATVELDPHLAMIRPIAAFVTLAETPQLAEPLHALLVPL
jgi:flagellar biosynthesis protein FlhB